MRLIKFRFYGELAEKFIDKVTLNVKTIRDAIDLLCVNFPGLRKYLMDSGDQGIAFKVLVGDTWQIADADELYSPLPQGYEVAITPVAQGSGRMGSIIAGVALLGLGISGVGFLGMSAFQVGLLGGVLLLQGLFGQQTQAPEEEEDTESFIFSGAVNSASVGSRVNILYGFHLIGSIVISAGISSSQYAPGEA